MPRRLLGLQRRLVFTARRRRIRSVQAYWRLRLLVPHSSIKFEVSDLERDEFEYELRSDSQERGVWVSRKVMQHGLEKVTL